MPDRNLLVDDRADAHAPQPHDRVADRFEHAPHLPLTSFMQHDLDERLLGPGFRLPGGPIGQVNLRRRGPLAVEDDPAPQSFEILFGGDAANTRFVDLLNLVAGMHQARRELAVIRQ